MTHAQRNLALLAIFMAGTGWSACRRAAEPTDGPPPKPAMTMMTDPMPVRPPKALDSMTRAERQAFAAVLSDSGWYRCCVDPACTSCLDGDDPACRCAEAIRAKDPVCGECYRGWRRGSGSVAGVTPEQVRRR